MTSKRSLAVYIILASAFIILTNVVYINYWQRTPTGALYTGANHQAASDKLVYMSLIQQGREGKLWMRNLHTTEPQQGLLFSPHWYIIGQTGKILHISNLASYQLYRLMLTVVFLCLLYLWLKRLFSRGWDIIGASVFVLFSGGLGWVQLLRHPSILQLKSQELFLNMPVDIYVSEGNTFLNFMQAPLFILSQLLLVAIFYYFVKWSQERNWRRYLGLGVVTMLLIMVHPYDFPIIAAVIGSWSVWYLARTKDWAIVSKTLLLFAGLVAAWLYNLFIVSREPILASWYRQNLVYSPPVGQYLWAYGILLLLWLAGMIYVWRRLRSNSWWILLGIWSTIGMLLLYQPLDINRRFINGWHIALALMAYQGFRWLCHRVPLMILRRTLVVVCYVALMSSFVFNTFLSVLISQDRYYYIQSADLAAIDYLRQNSTVDDKILTADKFMPFLLTSQLNRLVFRGHEHQTPEAHLKQQQMEWFFAAPEGSRAVDNKKEFLQREGISLIVVDKQFIAVPPDWLAAQDFVRSVYREQGVTIYRVVS